MKILLYTLLFFTLITSVQAQIVPVQKHEGFSFQGVARDASGNPVVEKKVKIKAGILTPYDSITYEETHLVSTDKFGLFSIAIGEGVVEKGNFSMLLWSSDFAYKLAVSIDPAGGNNFTLAGTSVLKSVPYAKYADKAGNGYWEKGNNGNINYTGGYVGINSTSDKAPFTMANSVTTQAIFGHTYPGVSIQQNWPGIGFNHYYKDGQKSISKGYGGYIGVDPNNGGMFFRTIPSAAAADQTAVLEERMFISPKGMVGIGNLVPAASLDVYRGTAEGGTAIFRGTKNASHFNYSSTEDTYIRGGKDGSRVFINDESIGDVVMVKDKGTVNIGALSKEYAFGTACKLNVVGNPTNAEKVGGNYVGGISILSNSTKNKFDGALVIEDHGDGEVVYINGNTGIGLKVHATTAIEATGEAMFYGTIKYSGGLTNTSDRRYKENINPLSSSLNKVMQLRGVSYKFKVNEFPSLNFNKSLQIGFIAQEVKEVVPEIVSKDKDGYLSVDYSKVTPLLVEAMKEQNAVIESQKSEIEKLNKEIAALKNQNTSLVDDVDTIKAQLQEILNMKASLK